ncbi:MAG: O-antigen ligase family protein [Capsulimonas sp.]|uniref:O-antigen ligase family protein n=1 Tax=Capsulimonas sp. TaxID=2494211 RepID=UPI003265C3F5
MTQAIVVLLSLVAFLAPLLAARPDEPIWSSFLGTAAMIAGLLAVIASWRQSSTLGTPAALGRSRWATVGLAVWVLFSILARIVHQHSSTAFLAPMLRGGSAIATDLALFLTAWFLATRHRDGRYVLMLAVLAGSAVAAAIGVQEYAIHLRDGESQWRVFGTSTPDYLAGYMAMTLPLTVALMFSAPTENRLPVLLGLIAVLQLATMLTTGSRFAIVSLAVSFAVFAFFAYRQKKERDAASPAPVGPNSRVGTIAGIVVTLLVLSVVAKPVVMRLMHNDANSGAFRIWTWKGSVHMALANPIFGSGVGTYVYDYPRYALTGFTRLAHNGYLQIADECGIPALVLFLALLVSLIAAVVTVLLRPAPIAESEEPSRLAAGLQRGDDRLLLAGLLAGLIAAMTQNLIDSDWSVFFIGSTFWIIAGLAAGMAQRATGLMDAAKPEKRASLGLAGVAAALVALFTFTNGVGATYSAQAKELVAQGGDAEPAYAAAQSWAPWDGRNLSDLAYKVFLTRQHNASLAETTLKNAIALEPSYLNYRRLGNLYKATGRTADAAIAYREGLRQDPASLDLLLDLASISTPDVALDQYRIIQKLERSPVGQVRALGDITEARFAIANAAVADESRKHGDKASATEDYERAAAVLEKYAKEGGQSNPQQQALLGGQSDPQREEDMAKLYRHVLEALSDVTAHKSEYLQGQRSFYYELVFESLIAAAYQAVGDNANALQHNETAARSIEVKSGTSGYPHPEGDYPITALYETLLDRIAALSPPEQAPQIEARRTKFLPMIKGVFQESPK